jgi:phosphopentomutase
MPVIQDMTFVVFVPIDPTAIAHLQSLTNVHTNHGNDPTIKSTNHTRERVPLLVVSGGESREFGIRDGFSDVGATAAAWLGVEGGGLPGESFVRDSGA